MGTDILLAIIFVGGPIAGIALYALWRRAYDKGLAEGKRYALAFTPLPGPRVIRYNAQPVRVERRLDYMELRMMEGDPRLKEHVIAEPMTAMTHELWHHAKIEESFDAPSCHQVFRATIMLTDLERDGYRAEIAQGWKEAACILESYLKGDRK